MRQYTRIVVHLHGSERKYLFLKTWNHHHKQRCWVKFNFFPLLRHCCGGFIPRFVVPFALILSAHAHRSSPISFFLCIAIKLFDKVLLTSVKGKLCAQCVGVNTLIKTLCQHIYQYGKTWYKSTHQLNKNHGNEHHRRRHWRIFHTLTFYKLFSLGLDIIRSNVCQTSQILMTISWRYMGTVSEERFLKII